MRKLALIAAALTLPLATAAAADAAVTANQGLTVKVTGKGGTADRPGAVGLSVRTTTAGFGATPDGTFGTKQAVIHFDKHLKFNNGKFPTCGIDQVARDAAACPKGSLVGSGAANAQINAAPGLKAAPTITAYNGPKNTLLLKLTKGAGDPVDASGVISAVIKKDKGAYGSKLVVTIPSLFYYQLGLPITLTNFLTNVKATYKHIPFVASNAGAHGTYKFGGDFTYVQVDKATGAETTNVQSVTTTARA